MRSTLFVKIAGFEKEFWPRKQGNREGKRKETEVMSWLMMCLILLLATQDCCLIYTKSLSTRHFIKFIRSLNVGVAILARRQSGPLLFQGILSSRWWYQ